MFTNIYRFWWLLALQLFLVGAVTANTPCITPRNTNGVCIPWRQCHYVNKLIVQHNYQLPQKDMDNIFKSRCNSGNEIHICCEVSKPLSSMAPVPRRGNLDLNPKGLKILQNTLCGIESQHRIAFGEEVDIGQFPWMALLRYDSADNPFQCGGTLITDRFVLTAAHCISDKLIGVRLGEHYVNEINDCQMFGDIQLCNPPAEDYSIASAIHHENYKEFRNDIGLIKLGHIVHYKNKPHIKPICLPLTPKSRQIDEIQEYLIAGWGTTEKKVASNALLMANVTSTDRYDCTNFYKGITLTNNHICAKGGDKVEHCAGDSGGPLFCNHIYKRTPRYIQYGIISSGLFTCGVKGAPGIYANVIDMLPWITDNIDE